MPDAGTHVASQTVLAHVTSECHTQVFKSGEYVSDKDTMRKILLIILIFGSSVSICRSDDCAAFLQSSKNHVQITKFDQYLESLFSEMKNVPKNDLDHFFIQSDLKTLQLDGFIDLTVFKGFKGTVSPQAISFSKETAQNSHLNPFHLITNPCSTVDKGCGSIVFFNGHVFADGFYRKSAHNFWRISVSEQRRTIRSLVEHQPWFEWNATEQRFHYRTTGSAEALLSQYQRGSRVTLYHGLNNHTLKAFKAATKLRKHFESRPLFTSPSVTTARSFGRGRYLHADFTLVELLALAKQKQIYVGLEGPLLEIALIEPESFDIFFKRAHLVENELH
ncbi:MAG: hypothetical protein HYW49_07600 [Deltaproteobacteria bacterium]|nr:hypothetical protein [Deltaproteobacteria bacterium]